MSEQPPERYLDGCTCFPDRFGRVSHRHVCIAHDIEYWNKRTLLGKVAADVKWLYRLNRVHWAQNTLLWIPIATLASLLGFVGLSTAGLYFWNRRHIFDR